MRIPIFTVDAFTDKPFSGNPAAVCVLENHLDESVMKDIASEMNLSETAFVVRKDREYDLRWFTPVTEVDLCGHATLASAHILWEIGVAQPHETLNFHTRSGLLSASGGSGSIELNFPLIAQSEIEPPPALERALGAAPVYVGKTDWNYLVELSSEHAVRSLDPDFGLLLTLPAWGTIVTARAESPGYDFVTRFFAPGKGVNEDPVTGSSHCVLGPYWQKKMNKSIFKAYQASSRGGSVGVRVENNRVHLAGKAITILKGTIIA